jgi:hypothetical protein
MFKRTCAPFITEDPCRTRRILDVYKRVREMDVSFELHEAYKVVYPQGESVDNFAHHKILEHGPSSVRWPFDFRQI